MAADQLEAGVLTVSGQDQGRLGHREAGLHRVVGEEMADRFELLGGEPDCAVGAISACGASLFAQLREVRRHGVVRTQCDQREQQLVQLLCVTDGRHRLLLDSPNGVEVELSQVALLVGQCSARHDRSRASFLQRCIVEEAVGSHVDDALRHGRGGHGVARMQAHLAALDPFQHLDQRVGIDRLVQAIVHRLGDQGMVGHFQRTRQVFLAADLRGEDGRKQVVGDHPLQIRRHFASPAASGDGEGSRRRPAPARVPERRVEYRLAQRLFGVGRLQILECLLERERLGRSQGQQDAFFVRRCLQLKVEADAEALAQRQSPGAIDARAERCMHDELLAAAFVEEALKDDVGVGRHHLKRRLRLSQILDDLLGS